MSTTVALSSVPVQFHLSSRSVSLSESAVPLFRALAPLHGLAAADVSLLERAAAATRFIAVMHPFGLGERELMRIALADLGEQESCVIEAAATYAADLAFEDGHLVWDRIDAQGRQRVMWMVAILRVSECLDRVCCASSGSVRATWSTDVLNLEIGGVPLSRYDLGQLAGRVAALEAITARRVSFTSLAQRRGAA